MPIKGAALPIPPILREEQLSHKSLPPVTCQCQTSEHILCVLFLLPQILGNHSHFRGQMGVPLPTVQQAVAFCCLSISSHHEKAEQMQHVSLNSLPFPQRYAFLLSALLAGRVGRREENILVSPSPNFFLPSTSSL